MKKFIVKVTLLSLLSCAICLLPSCSKDEAEADDYSYDNSYTDDTAQVEPEPEPAPAPAKPTEAEIKFHMEVGETHNFTLREEVDLIEQNKSRITKNRIKYWVEIDYYIECVEIDPADGAYIVVQEWTRGRGGSSTYDWDTDKHLRAPDNVKRYRRLIGNHIKLAIMPNGEIGEIWNGDVLADALLYEKNINKKDYEEDEMYIYEGLLESMLDEVWESKEDMLPMMPRSFPSKPLRYGDHWVTKQRASTSRPGYIITEMEFMKIRDNAAYLDGTVSMHAGDDLTDGNAIAKVSDQYKAAGNGEYQVDLKTGFFKKAEIKAEVDYDAHIDDRLWQNEKDKKFQGTMKTVITMTK